MAGNECLPGAFEAWSRPGLDATTGETERLLPDERAGGGGGGGNRTAPVRRHHDNLFCNPTRTQGQRLSERTIANTVLTVSDLRQGPLTANGFLIHRNISFQFILARFTINSTAICINLFEIVYYSCRYNITTSINITNTLFGTNVSFNTYFTFIITNFTICSNSLLP